MHKYDLTIITCTKNRIYFLRKKINELKKISKILNVELIIVTEKGDNESLKFLKKNKNKRIKVLTHSFNNINKSTNKAIPFANGKYIVIHGDDDYFIYTNLIILKKIFSQNYDWIIARAKYYAFNETQEIRKFSKLVKNIFIFLNIKFFLKSFNYLQCPSVFFKKEIAIKVGGYPQNIKYGSDHHFWKKLIKYENLTINEYLSITRYSNNTISGSLSSKKYFFILSEIAKNKNILSKLIQFLFLLLLILKETIKRMINKNT